MKIAKKAKNARSKVVNKDQFKMIESLKKDGLLPVPSFNLAYGPDINKINANIVFNSF
ncbi:TPA: hypothetical protein ACPDKO_000135 [Pasteurella multocida]